MRKIKTLLLSTLLIAACGDDSGDGNQNQNLDPDAGSTGSSHLVGWVLDGEGGQPIAGARVLVQTLNLETATDTDGKFVLEVPPGETHVVIAESDGFSYGIRRVRVAHGHVKAVPPIHLAPLDPVTTDIPIEGGIHVNSDETVELEFLPGSLDGAATVRTTRYKRGKVLPAPLPPLTRVTTAVDVDLGPGELSGTAVIRVRNTLGFDPGTEVPVGWLDRDTGIWHADGMGTVTQDGMFLQYEATHFSSLDLNFPAVVDGHPGVPEANVGNGQEPEECPGSAVGLSSGNLTISHTTPPYLSLEKSHSVTLIYRSETVNPKANLQLANRVSVDFNGDPIGLTPQSVKIIVDVEGRYEEFHYQGSDGDSAFSYLWDGVNGLGEQVPTGVYPARLEIVRYFDQAEYATAACFGCPPIESLGIPTAEPIPLPSETTVPVAINNLSESPIGIGWAVAGLKRLYLDGSSTFAMVSDGGAQPRAYTLSARGDRLAGTGEEAFDPPTDGDSARQSALWSPVGVAAGNAGTVYLADFFSMIWSIDSGGTMTRVAGTGTEGYSGDGGAATSAQISRARSLAVSSNGDLYIAETENHVIRRVDTSGTISTVAGDGGDGWGLEPGEGDGAGATATSLYDLRGVTVDDSGNVLFTDGHGCLRRVDTAGVLSTLTCDLTEPRGVAVGADGVAYVATEPDILAVAPDGTVSVFAVPPRPGFNPAAVTMAGPDALYVLDVGRNQICRLGKDGTYSLVAGVESNAPWETSSVVGDGGPATEIPLQLTTMASMALDPDGNLIVADDEHHVVWRISTAAPTGGAAVFASAPSDSRTLLRRDDGTYRLYIAPAVFVTFDQQGMQTAHVDGLGRETQFQYDAEGRLISITDPAGKATSFVYNADGLLANITDPAGRQTTIQHDGDGHVTSVTDPLGQDTSYGYDADHHLTLKTDPAGYDTVYTFNGDRMVSVTLATGEVWSVARSAVPGNTEGMGTDEGTEDNPATPESAGLREIMITDGEGNTRTLRLGRDGRVQQRADELGRVSTMVYDRYGQMIRHTGPDGIETRIERGAMTYRMRSVVRSVLRWDEATLMESMPTKIQWDPALGKVTHLIRPGETSLATATTQMTYDANGFLTAMQDPLGYQSTLANNSAGQPTSVTDATGRTWTVAYDAAGNVSRMDHALGPIVTVERDPAGRPNKITDGLGRDTVITRDALGRITTLTNPAGNTVTYGYTGTCGTCGSAGKPTTITDPTGRTTTFQYNAVGKLEQVTDPQGDVHQYAYDLTRRLTAITGVDGSVTTLTRDTAGRVVSVEDGDGRVTDYTYDVADRVTSVEDDEALLSYAYDVFGLITQSSITTVGGDIFTTDVVVEPWNGLVSTVTDPEGRIHTYEYTERHQLRQAFQDSSADPDEAFWFQYEYDEAGRLASRIMSDPDTNRWYNSDYSFDAAGRFAGIVHSNDALGPIWQSQLTRDAAARITNLVTTHGTQDLTYNDDDRLTGVTYSGAATLADETFTYDALGNRTDDGQVYGVGDRLLEDATYTYSYDDRGRMFARTHKVTGAELLLSWNDRDQLVTAERWDGAANLLQTTTYTYDPAGRRIAKDVDGVRTQTAWQGFAPTASYDDAGTLQTQWYRCPVTGELMGVESGAYRGYVFNDHLGSPRAVAGYETTSLAWQAEYPAYGDAEVDPAATLNNPHRFPGQMRDEETGLHYNVFRYYDPASGRYLSQDPIWSPAHSPYAYAGGNPAMAVDPLGLYNWFPRTISTPRFITDGVMSTGSWVFSGIGNAAKFLYRANIEKANRDHQLKEQQRKALEQIGSCAQKGTKILGCAYRCNAAPIGLLNKLIPDSIKAIFGATSTGYTWHIAQGAQEFSSGRATLTAAGKMMPWLAVGMATVCTLICSIDSSTF